MDVLIIVSSDAAAPVLLPMAKAFDRAGASWGAFFTHQGVKLLTDAAIAEAMGRAVAAVACQESWNHQVGDISCPVEFGSQTNNSAMVGEARRVVSL
ncbi:MAG: hypothetical protein ACR2PO_00745 [Methyloligellaceae bacterium]